MTDTSTAPSRHDVVVRGLSEVVGGPLGDHARLRPDRFWTPGRVVLAVTVVIMLFGWLQKSPCRDGAWQDNEQYSRACYTDVLALYYAEKLNEGQVPYLDYPVEYPVLTGAMMGAIGLPVHALGQSGGGVLNEGRLFYDLTTLVLGLFALLTAWSVLRMRPDRPWDAAMVALAPVFVVTASVNWDLLAVGLCTAALLAWSRAHPTTAGVLFGLAAAAKFYPLLILGPLVLVAMRDRRLVAAGRTVGTAALSWAVVNVPVYLVAPDSWLRFYRFSSERAVDWGTFWYVGVHWPTGPDTAGLAPFLALAADVPTLNLLSAGIFALCCAGIALLIATAPRTPRLEAVALLVVAAFLVTNKVWSQQFVLWLIPLVVLARPRWGAFLAWQAAEVVYFLAFYKQLLGAASGTEAIPESVFLLAAGGRAITLVVLCGLVVGEILRPGTDVVRAGEPPPHPRVKTTAPATSARVTPSMSG